MNEPAPAALTGPVDVGVGHALITLVSPHRGREREYNRWYEDDHFWGRLAPFIPSVMGTDAHVDDLRPRGG